MMAGVTDSSPVAMDCEEGEIILNGHSISDVSFDTTIGHIEDIIMDSIFRKLQNDFMVKHYHNFDNSEENKLIYTEIFQEYTALIERHLEMQLSQRIPNFSMEDFTKQLLSRRSELDGEVFEMLLTFSDFVAFKEMFIDYKIAQEEKSGDLSSGLCISAVPCICRPTEQSAAEAQNISPPLL